MAEEGSSRRRWKRHVVRQLELRDRAQKARFWDLVQGYTNLLEKSNSGDLSLQFQIPSMDHQMGGPACRPNGGPSTCGPDPDWNPAALLTCLQNSHQPSLLELETKNGELAFKIYECRKLLKEKEAGVEEQEDKLAVLNCRLLDLEEWHCKLQRQAQELSWRISAQKAEYDLLQRHFQQWDGVFRQALEEGQKLLGLVLQRKADCAQCQNDKIERLKQAQLTKDLQEATSSTLSVKIDPEEGGAEKPKMAARHDPEEKKGGEKLSKRPFRSASATLISTTRCKDVVKGWFDFRLKRGNSVSSGSLDQCCSFPSCVVACLPSCVADEQEGHRSEINAVAFSPDSALLATGCVDRLLKLWSLDGGFLEEKQILESCSGSITSIAFDPLGCYALAATFNKNAQLWKVGENQAKDVLTGHTDKVTAAKFKSTWHQAVTGSRDRTVKEWDLVKRACSRTIQFSSYCNDVVCCDNIIVSGHYDQNIRFWDSRVAQCINEIPVGGKVTSLSLSPDQLELLSCSRDNELKVIDLRMHTVQQVFREDGFKCGSDGTKAVFSPDKKYALAGSADGTLFVWNATTGELEKSLAGPHRSSVNSVAWGPSGVHIGSVDQCGKVVLWR